MRKKTKSALPEALVEQIYDRTGGVPLFVEEFTKMVQESGRCPDQEGDSSAADAAGREIPATLQDLMMARLDRMEGERELAQLAATLGREFSYELLAAVATLDEPTLAGANWQSWCRPKSCTRRAGRRAAATSSSTRCSRMRCTTRW